MPIAKLGESMSATVEAQNEEMLKLVRQNRVRLLKVQILVRRLRRREQAIAKGVICFSTQASRVENLSQ
jgi:hypothetical protein